MLHTASGTELVTKYGTVEERRAMAEWLRSRLLLPAAARVDTAAPPPGWRMSIESGSTRLTQEDPRARRIASAIMWFIVLFLAAILYGAREGTTVGVVIAGLLIVVAASGAIWVTFAHRGWLVRHGELTAQMRLLNWERTREFKSARLEVMTWTDSDNDDHYKLNVFDSQGRRTIASELHDESDIVALGQWLATRTGFPLTLPPQTR
jgi:hypothetical protein